MTNAQPKAKASSPVKRPPDRGSTGISELRSRLEGTDLIPSQRRLLEDIEQRFALLSECGVSTIAELRSRLRNPKSILALAETSRVEADYLVLLNRAVAGFFPKPRALKAVLWLDQKVVSILHEAGIRDTDHFNKAATGSISQLERELDLKRGDLSDVAALSDLSRVQWVSPNFSGALIAAGYRSARAVASADPQALYEATAKANEESAFYKGKVGLRDIQRVVHAARYAHWTVTT